ncbi:DUF6884 domain-containing protein [Streptomyces sp. NPDC048659]|uniref:DUF6884 domain-containing protein n=1 Tax=Streptomyces sp. NPDC048659 TaxID=3155489 RepID=UPI003421869A
MTAPATVQPGIDRAALPTNGLVVIGCSRRKLPGTDPVPALELYQGWCFPQLRERIAGRPEFRARTLVLSARHGLIGADEPIAPYHQVLTPERALSQRDLVSAVLAEHLERHPAQEALLLLEPLYFQMLGLPPLPVVHQVSNPTAHWTQAERVLDDWGWTT